MIETTLGNFTETNITVNTKAPKGLDLFHRLEVAKVPVYALDTDTKQTNKQTSQVAQKLRILKTRLVFFNYLGDSNRRKVNGRCNDGDGQGICIRSEWRYSTEMHKHRYAKTA